MPGCDAVMLGSHARLLTETKKAAMDGCRRNTGRTRTGADGDERRQPRMAADETRGAAKNGRHENKERAAGWAALSL
ncbi:MAG: hypothetical protein J6Y05_04610 [Bacteroidales bacterium]|nr:hypothetical protein [Bacteroidales bacterium]